MNTDARGRTGVSRGPWAKQAAELQASKVAIWRGFIMLLRYGLCGAFSGIEDTRATCPAAASAMEMLLTSSV